MDLIQNKGIDDALSNGAKIHSLTAEESVAYVRENLASFDQIKRLSHDEVSQYMYIGLAGDLVKKIEPETESDSVALLVQFLIAFGNLIGRSAHFMIEGNPHFTNLFGVLIGSTGNGRKGTSWSQVKRFLIKVDQNWLQTKVLGGIASGETIVERIKDDILDGSSSKGFDDPKKPLANNRDDKRLFIQEPEFSGLLKVSTRDGSIISQILRKSWDSDRIENQTKYDFSVCKEPHISLIGHITKEELAITFSKTEAASGFGNRFLYFEVARSKKLPFGGKIEDVNFGPEYEKIFRAIEFAKRMPLIKESPESRHIWPQIYNELTKEHPGLMGAMLNRAAPMVRRLSLIYAVLDCSKMIEVKHTLAALAVWSRSELTVEKIFKGMLSDKVATAILNLITESDTGVTRTQIRDLFSKNESKERIDMALETLEHAKLIYKESIPAGPTGGKPTEKWWLARFSR